MKIIALTGGIGCGKSTVADFFRAKGIPCIDADKLCHGLYHSGNPDLMKKITERWGNGVLTPDGSLDRAAVANIVFQNKDELNALNDMIRPFAEMEMHRRIDQYRLSGEKMILLDVPLLYEAGWDAMADRVIAVWTPSDLRNERLRINRGWDTAEIQRRKMFQMDENEKLERADYGLINSGTKEELEAQCEAVWRKLCSEVDDN
ncbi:MAG: dephospho-CoA kinase [Lentisphaeria bacterium]|nr:dephospho-CoA kinase [Lentisphaeria bacterium]